MASSHAFTQRERATSSAGYPWRERSPRANDRSESHGPSDAESATQEEALGSIHSLGDAITESIEPEAKCCGCRPIDVLGDGFRITFAALTVRNDI